MKVFSERFRYFFYIYLVLMLLNGSYVLFNSYNSKSLFVIFVMIGIQMTFVFWVISHGRQLGQSVLHLLQLGGNKAAFAGFLGWTILYAIDTGRLLIRTDLHLWELNLMLLAVLYTVGLVLSVVAGGVGGYILAYLEYQNRVDGVSTRLWAILKGAILGALVGITLSIAVVIAVRRGSFELFLFRSILATTISTISGGLVGNVIFMDITKNLRAA